jgi:GT2 family glycosyltransferase
LVVSYILLGLAGFYLLSQFAALVALAWARQRSLSLSAARQKPASYPGVSIITSLKGPTPGARESVKSLLLQVYPGPVEIVFATLDAAEPLIADIKAVIAETPSSCAIKWIHPVATSGLNPRTAKIAKAYEASIHPWVFMVCVDTRFAPDYLKKAIELTELKPERYVTSFPVIDQPEAFSAKLEAVGLNVDVSQFFLLSSFSPKAACAYGGAFLFSRSLAEKAGAYTPLLPLLTDDITLAKALSREGGLCFLTDELAYVRQEKHSFRGYWTRQVRWRMIARYFLPDLFWLSPLSWTQLFLLIGGVILHENILLWMILVLMLSRIFVGAGVQLILKTPKGDWRHAWVLPIYDWLAIPAWCAAVVKNSISWGPTLMILNRKGAVVRSIDLSKNVPKNGADDRAKK